MYLIQKIVVVLFCVICVFFEGEFKDGDFFVGDRVEQIFDDFVGEAFFLIFIDVNYLLKKYKLIDV